MRENGTSLGGVEVAERLLRGKKLIYQHSKYNGVPISECGKLVNEYFSAISHQVTSTFKVPGISFSVHHVWESSNREIYVRLRESHGFFSEFPYPLFKFVWNSTSFSKLIQFLAALLLKQSSTYLVYHACVCMYTKIRPPPRNGISIGNSLISSPDLDSPQKFILDWYLFLNRSLQITLLQIYFWYYKTIWGQFKHGGLLLQTTANQIGRITITHSANQNAGTTKNPATCWRRQALIQWECMITIPHTTEVIRMQDF